MSIVKQIRKAIFGYDIFISYSRKDSLDYAYSIAQYFMKKGYECYIDQLSSITPGRELPPNIKDAVKRSTAFVLIGSDGAQTSEAIDKELQLFLENNKNKPLIPITVAGAINGNARWYEKIAGLALIDDTGENLKVGTPAQDVLDRIENALKFTKKSTRLRTISLAIILFIIAVSGLAIFFTNSKSKQAKEAIAEKEQADNLRNVALTEKEQANNLRLVALNEKEDAVMQMQQASILKDNADSLKNIALNDKEQAEKLKNIADSLKLIAENRVENLNVQSQMLQTRIAAMNMLESDPVKAYRLAEQAYTMDKDADNSALIRLAASSIDYYYKSVFDHYQILDFKEPYILLIKKDAKDNEPNLAVYEMKSSLLKNTQIHADYAWIIPDKTTWRILTRNWHGGGSDAIPEYQLWNDSSASLSDKIKEGGLSIAQFINPHKVGIKLYRQPKTLLWDLLSNNMEYISHDTTESFGGGYFREIYGALDTRTDGISAAHHDNGLVLVDINGNIDTTTYTQVSFDPSSFFSRAKWSPDDKYLALNYFDRKRLGIWDPVKKSFVWLDPDGWVVNSFSWSQNGHLLAFSGRTENDIDVTVEIVDASSPQKSRRIVHQGDIPIQSIAFLPGDEKVVICDKESNMSIIDLATIRVVGKGQQSDLVKSSPLGFYSSSVKDFKSWHKSPAPSKNWFFKSDSAKRYYPEGTVDPSNRWIAVPYFRKVDTTSGVEIRNTISIERKNFSLPYYYKYVIRFTDDGNWLILCNSKTLYFWNTNNWNQCSIEVDRTFEEFNAEKNIIYASFDSAEHRVTYKYDLNAQKPKFVGRDPRVIKIKTDDTEEESLSDEIEKSINGWKLDKLYKYRAAGWEKSGPWAIRLTCRDQALGAQDCDVLFVPTDLTWLMKVYDQLLWKPKREELLSLIKN